MGFQNRPVPWNGLDGQFNRNTTDARNSAELEFGLTGVHMKIKPPLDQVTLKGRFRIDSGLNAVVTMAPVASGEDPLLQGILKLWPPHSLDYRVRYKPYQHNVL